MNTKIVKYLSFVLALAASCMVSAQYADLYYHRHGDTIVGKPDNGFAYWWRFNDFREEQRSISSVNYTIEPHHLELHYAYTPSPLRVVGAAALLRVPSQFRDTAVEQHIYIYDATPTDFNQVMDFTVDFRQWPAPRIMEIPLNELHPFVYGGRVRNDCCINHPVTEYHLLYEFYFDSAITLQDSFYMGMTHVYPGAVTPPVVLTTFSSSDIYCNGTLTHESACGIHEKAKVIRSDYPDSIWWNTDLFYIQAMHPIIEVDTTVPPEWYCPPLTGLQVTAVDSNTAVVTWDPFVNHTFVEVEYGPVDRSLGAQRVDTVIHTSLTLTGLNPSVPLYRLRARALCENAHEGDTPAWTRDIFFSTAAPDTSGIDGPRPLADHVSLAPNPASDEVEVHSPFGMRYIEVFDMKGMPVYSDYASHHRETLSLRGWRKGTYVMRITTPQGVLSKILVKR